MKTFFNPLHFCRALFAVRAKNAVRTHQYFPLNSPADDVPFSPRWRINAILTPNDLELFRPGTKKYILNYGWAISTLGCSSRPWRWRLSGKLHFKINCIT